MFIVARRKIKFLSNKIIIFIGNIVLNKIILKPVTRRTIDQIEFDTLGVFNCIYCISYYIVYYISGNFFFIFIIFVFIVDLLSPYFRNYAPQPSTYSVTHNPKTNSVSFSIRALRLEKCLLVLTNRNIYSTIHFFLRRGEGGTFLQCIRPDSPQS